jgi:hypothetical protein
MTAPRKSNRGRPRSLEDDNAALREAVEELYGKFFNLSRWMAERDFGADRLDAAMQAMFRASPDVQAAIVGHAHPFQAAIEWHRREGMH